MRAWTNALSSHVRSLISPSPIWIPLRVHREDGEVPTRGQLAAVGDRLLCMGSPWLTEPKGLKELGLTFDDFAIHDSMVDLLQVVQG